MEASKIKVVFSDTGHWLARCDHDSGVIELNRRDFPRLSPMMQDYILVHEYVHLLYDEYDERRCNEITDGIFISRAGDDAEREARRRFVNSSSDDGTQSHFPVAAALLIASTVIGVGSKIAAAQIKNSQKYGYYGMKKTEQRELVTRLMNTAFAESANTNASSAKDIFWDYMSQCGTGDASYTEWARRNTFVTGIIRQCEQDYGFGFEERGTVDLTSFTGVKIAIAAALICATVLTIKALRR